MENIELGSISLRIRAYHRVEGPPREAQWDFGIAVDP